MAQWVKAFATKPEDLSSVPGSHLVEGENYYIEAASKQKSKPKGSRFNKDLEGET